MKLFESIKEKTSKGANPQAVYDDSISEVINEASVREFLSFVEEIKVKSSARLDLLLDYDEMSKDSVIGSALELLSDDSTRKDEINGRAFWVTDTNGGSSDLTETLNKVLDGMGWDKQAWAIAYNVAKNGECFLKTYYSEFSEMDDNNPAKSKLGYYFEIEQDPSSIADLLQYGDTVGFQKTSKEKKDGKEVIVQSVFSNMDYIHICRDRGVKREEVWLDVTDKTGKKKHERYQIRYGSSFLESAREAWKILNLLEIILISLRFVRSSAIRLFKIEVGGASKSESIKIIREFKTKIRAIQSLNKKEGFYSESKKPIPIGQDLVITTRGGKGDVTSEFIGGDYDPKELLDLDYYRSKLFAALKIPKAFLGLDESMSGGIGNSSMLIMDEKYARLIESLVSVLKEGVEQCLDFWCVINNHEDWIGNYKVCSKRLVTSTTITEREDKNNALQLCESILNLVGNIEGADTTEIIKVLLREVFGEGPLAEKLFDCIEEVKGK